MATRHCVDLGGHLIEPRTERLYNISLGEPGVFDPRWIGASDLAAEGQWVWASDGASVETSIWVENEPNSATDSVDCMAQHGFGLQCIC